MSNEDKKTYSSQEAKDVFANQLERFELSEQEQAVAEKLGLDEMDLSGFSFGDKVDGPQIDSYSLATISITGYDTLDSYNEENELKPMVDEALDILFDTIKKDEYSKYTMDMSEKLLTIACGRDMVEAVICVAKHLAAHKLKYDEDICTNQPGTTGDLLNYEYNLSEILKYHNTMDVDTKTTLAEEMHLIENEIAVVENITVPLFIIVERMKKANENRRKWGDSGYNPEILDIIFSTVIEHYEFVLDAFYTIQDEMQTFVSKYLDGDITLNDSGEYNRELSVILKAKYNAFGDKMYPLPDDKHRTYIPEKETKPKKKVTHVFIKDEDAKEYTPTFFKNKKYLTGDKKRAAMIATCVENLKNEKVSDSYVIELCEKIMVMDKENNFNEIIASHKDRYEKQNHENKFDGYFGYITNEILVNLKGIEDLRTQPRPKVRKDIPTENKILPPIFFVLALALAFTPLVTFEAVLETIIKGIYVIIFIICLLTTGPVALITGPIVIVVFNVCLNIGMSIFEIFGNPILITKLLFALLLAGVGALFGEEYMEVLLHPLKKRRKIKEKRKYISRKSAEAKPMVENILSLAKEKNMPAGIVKYYERMMDELGKY